LAPGSVSSAPARLAGADLKGLNAADYDGDRWTERMTALAGASGPGQEAFDVALTASVLRYLSDVGLGRINPARIDQGPDGAHRRRDLPAALRRSNTFAGSL